MAGKMGMRFAALPEEVWGSIAVWQVRLSSGWVSCEAIFLAC